MSASDEICNAHAHNNWNGYERCNPSQVEIHGYDLSYELERIFRPTPPLLELPEPVKKLFSLAT